MEALVFSAAGMLIAVVGHILACRLGRPGLMAYGVSFLAGCSAAAVLSGTMQSAWGVLTTLEIYGAWWFVFLNLVQASESSLRMQILREVISAGGALPMADLLARYNDESLLSLRLSRLLASGSVVRSDSRLHVRSALLHGLARFFLGLKLLTLGKRSEFD